MADLTDQKAAPKTVTSRERQAQAVELRKAGASYRQIAKTLSITGGRAHQLVTRALDEINTRSVENAEALKRMELERLDEIQVSLWAARANPRVADSLLRVVEQRAKLLGLYAPVKLDAGLRTQELDGEELLNKFLGPLAQKKASENPVEIPKQE